MERGNATEAQDKSGYWTSEINGEVVKNERRWAGAPEAPTGTIYYELRFAGIGYLKEIVLTESREDACSIGDFGARRSTIAHEEREAKCSLDPAGRFCVDLNNDVRRYGARQPDANRRGSICLPVQAIGYVRIGSRQASALKEVLRLSNCLVASFSAIVVSLHRVRLRHQGQIAVAP
jgi:hypothetical protein